MAKISIKNYRAEVVIYTREDVRCPFCGRKLFERVAIPNYNMATISIKCMRCKNVMEL